MHLYKVTCLFQADWSTIYPALFGEVEHSYSLNDKPNVATYGFPAPQTPADLGPLVRVELITAITP